jgi:hypothetical protein
VTILTKCNSTISLQDLPGETHANDTATHNSSAFDAGSPAPPLVQVVSLPNVGRCDHSYAYWISQVLIGTKGDDDDGRESIKETLKTNQTIPFHELVYCNYDVGDIIHHHHKSKPTGDPFRRIANSIDATDMVLFLKDNDNTYRGALLEDSIGLSDILDVLTGSRTTAATTYGALRRSAFSRPISRGMACQSYPNSNHFPTEKLRKQHRFTNLAHRSVLWTFLLDVYVRASVVV